MRNLKRKWKLWTIPWTTFDLIHRKGRWLCITSGLPLGRQYFHWNERHPASLPCFCADKPTKGKAFESKQTRRGPLSLPHFRQSPLSYCILLRSLRESFAGDVWRSLFDRLYVFSINTVFMVFAFLNGRFEPLFIDMDDGGAMRRVICFLRLSNN